MGNVLGTIKKFISNKNTVTILAVLVGVVVLWYFYNYRVEQAITTVKIPYAVSAIGAGKKIESDNLKLKEITRSTIKNSDIVTDMSFLNGKYICYGNSIPKDGFLYKSQVCEYKDLKDTVFDNMSDNEKLYTLSVDSKSTYANSIIPGDYVDLYLQAKNEDGRIIYGPLIENVEVRAVRDANNKDVVWDTTAGAPSHLLFVVPDEIEKCLHVSELITGYSIKILPVPKSASYTQNPGEIKVASQYLYDFIMNKAATIVD